MEKLFHLGVKALITDPKGKVLLLRSLKGYWDFPGGRVQGGESKTEALCREVLEETNLTLSSPMFERDTFLTPLSIDHTDGSSVGLLLCVYECPIQDVSSLRLSDEHCEYVWQEKDQVSQLIANFYPSRLFS